MLKKFITRQDIKDRRMAMPDEEVTRLSEKICDRVLETAWYRDAAVICLYLAIRKEVNTSRIIKQAYADGKRVAAPKVSGNEMEFYYFASEDELREGAYHIPEPSGTEVCDTGQEGVLLLMPGVAFDEAGNRIGYGGGYYDRYLASHGISHKMALAYELQITGQLEAERFDVKPDIIVTERRIIV